MYFTYSGSAATSPAATTSWASTAPRQRWLFAEGYTGAGFDEYLTHPEPQPGRRRR